MLDATYVTKCFLTFLILNSFFYVIQGTFIQIWNINSILILGQIINIIDVILAWVDYILSKREITGQVTRIHYINLLVKFITLGNSQFRVRSIMAYSSKIIILDTVIYFCLVLSLFQVNRLAYFLMLTIPEIIFGIFN